MESPDQPTEATPSLATIASLWLKLGATGFGGPPAHVALLRTMVVDQHGWISDEEFEHAVAATNLLPGPASTQLAIYCGWRLRRTLGALVAGTCFIVPGLILIIALAAALLSAGSPRWVSGAALGAGAAVPIVALRAASDLAIPSFRRSKGFFGARARWLVWITIGFVACITLGSALVLALVLCGAFEVLIEWYRHRRTPRSTAMVLPMVITGVAAVPGLAWLAIKVGALSFGGGFVIVPLMQADAVKVHHWMTAPQFLAAVALGQITPGPVVQTIAVVGYAAGGVAAALLAAAIAFAPSFLFIIFGGSSFERLRTSPTAQGFLAGAGPAAIGAIAGTAILLSHGIEHLWQLPLLFLAVIWLLLARRGTVSILLFSGFTGAILGILGVPLGF